ncbi:PfkB family carbohydrate kinase [Starkeya koreensis]|uniref:PfkB family carbohydrate kinase n=1 Tax=Ancylobacter koreensis TaxID=266121 RepID=A0ABT0DIH4_9HYPH|nr:PfkB family carbohydrate kinase [Ancylobacter koreensis]MCK0207071.1 PfkB family carbohydrate kinase [Ancylobacter koreensis]
MGHVLVVGSVNVDRIVRIARPLGAGGRVSVLGAHWRCGGGGFATGAALLALGHRVSLVATLSADAAGEACRAVLAQLGFDLRYLAASEAPTVPLEIFVDPAGERTIVAPAASEARRLTTLPALAADLAYINVRRAEAGVLDALAGRCRVVAQVPLEAGERRPAEALIASASDHAFALGEGAFDHARRIGGDGLKVLVATDGARPVHLSEAHGRMQVPLAPVELPEGGPRDSTGAGDVFAAGFIDGCLRGEPYAACAQRGSEIAARFLADRKALWGDAALALDMSLRSAAGP